MDVEIDGLARVTYMSESEVDAGNQPAESRECNGQPRMQPSPFTIAFDFSQWLLNYYL